MKIQDIIQESEDFWLAYQGLVEIELLNRRRVFGTITGVSMGISSRGTDTILSVRDLSGFDDEVVVGDIRNLRSFTGPVSPEETP